MKKFSFSKKKKRKKFYFFIDFLSNNPIHNLKEIIKFLEKWDFTIRVGSEVTVFFDILKKDRMKRAIDWFKVMKSKYSIIMKIITSEVDLYLFLQRRFWGST